MEPFTSWPSYFTVAAALTLCTLAWLAWATRKTVDVQGPTEFPIIQSLPWVIIYGHESILTGVLRATEMFKWQTWTMALPLNPRYILTTDPANVEHILKTNFNNYVKGWFLKQLLGDLLGNGIFAVDGDLWHAQRKVASQLFSYRNFRDHIMAIFAAHADAVIALLRQHAASGAPVDMHALFHRFTLDAIAEIAFGAPIDSIHHPQHPFAVSFDRAQQIIDARVTTPGWQWMKYILPREYELRAAVRVMDAHCARMIAERRAAGDFDARSDVLSRFMALKDDATGERMYCNNDAFLRDIIMSFLIAGRDTTAQALSWCLHAVMTHPHVHAGIVDEIARVTAARAGRRDFSDATYDDVLHELKYTVATVQETLRLYPSVPKDTKLALADDVLPDGTRVPAGTLVAYLPHAMGRSPLLWGDDAHVFDPSRFLRGERYSPFKFIAFNAGPRACLGQHMALVEASYLMARLQSEFTFTLVPGHVVTHADSLTLPMAHGLRVHVHPAAE